jgi:hypothetical protein
MLVAVVLVDRTFVTRSDSIEPAGTELNVRVVPFFITTDRFPAPPTHNARVVVRTVESDGVTATPSTAGVLSPSENPWKLSAMLESYAEADPRARVASVVVLRLLRRIASQKEQHQYSNPIRVA